MSKRTAVPVNGERQSDQRPPKRQRIETPARVAVKAEDIFSSKQLSELLTFQQDAAQRLRSGISSFKNFLQTILYPTDEAIVPRQRAILRDFLDSQKPRSTDEDAVFLSNLMQTWGFAAQTNNDYLLSSAIAVLALLLKTVSSHPDLQEYGLLLCRTVLQPSQLKLLSRGLSAPKHKEHIISPSLRLLTEVVSFDSGAQAKQLYAKREFTFDVKIIGRNLGIRRAQADDVPTEKRKPTVRSNAVRYVLANFKYQNEGAKIDILKHGFLLKALFDHLREDPPSLAIEILQTVKSSVISDGALPRASKTHLLTDRNLESIASLYRVAQPEESEHERSLDVVAHELLLFVCTSPDAGALIPSSGWYPPGTDKDQDQDEEQSSETKIDLGLDSIEWFERFRSRVTIRNPALASFAQSLRPYANKLEQELLLAILDACPELVADYFFKKTGFTFEPKLTATWIGYASFVFSTIQLPVPSFFGRKNGYASVPPPTSLVMENLLPQPLTQKVLTKCLTLNTDLVTFFAVRIITIAFQKLHTILQLFKEASIESKSVLWDQAATRLVSEFSERCPKMKDVISAFRSIPEESFLQREAVSRLLSMYYEVAPQVALTEKFDVSIALSSLLSNISNTSTSGEDRELQLLELAHIVKVARHSPDMRWWHKPEALPLSPFSSVLKVLITSPESSSSSSLRRLLTSVIREHGILQIESRLSALDALTSSLRLVEDRFAVDVVFVFLDDCFGRFVRKPIKYQDDMDTYREQTKSDSAPVSLLLATLVEQWPFVVKNGGEGSVIVAKWLSSYLDMSVQIGEDRDTLQLIRKTMNTACAGTACEEAFKSSLEPESLKKHLMTTAEEHSDLHDGPHERVNHSTSKGVIETSLEIPPKEDDNHPGLHRWVQKEVDEAVDDGNVGELMLCLCSEHTSIRRQALINLQKLMAKVQSSDYEEKEQMYLLLGELTETARSVVDQQPLPYLVGAFAARAVTVIATPTHFLYPKINAFLTKGPSWNIGRLPSYWAEKIILNPPEDDNCYWKEADWFLEFCYEGLRTPMDMEIFRVRNVFERILAIYDLPSVSGKMKVKVLRLLFRAAAVGGSTTLITRSGILSWVQLQLSHKDGNEATHRRLAERLYSTCDHAKVDEWSSGGVKGILGTITARQ
ncbi:hypothetical protein K490DRAFT_50448 [Saccharata proteae CBS 121410]|uniref:Ribosome biogenesis protein Urb1 n=1 Tax=Saccharata proteae CBS 121410 TaxID=1314787 RepID=A0A9P4HQ52_9PEZI|nr:hypothetical protein K490DRAFT_50448 [Saccharata proteae CBS 121410]